MPRLGADSRLLVATIVLALLYPCVASSEAAVPPEEICDVNADLALGLEDFPAAIALHRKVLHAHKDNALAHYHLGFAYGMTGQTREEIGEYLTAAKLGLRKWDLFLNLGIAYLAQNDWPQAIKALQTAVLIAPDHPEAHFNLAIAYEKGDRLHEALQQITASLLLVPEDLDELNTKGIICAKMGDLVCARGEWAHLVQVAPDYTPARVNLAILSSLHMPVAASTCRAPDGRFAFAR
jgi:Flp pilus assembly protein TadD